MRLSSLRGPRGEVYATVGTIDKARFLAHSIAILHYHIVSSRDPSTLFQAMSITGKTGFDVILSTVVGRNLLYASLIALAPIGHIIDVGRLDVLDYKRIGKGLFQKDANFTSFDLNLVLDHDLELDRQLMKTVDELYRAGDIDPIRTFATADVSELNRVLLSFLKGFMKGTHVGQIAVALQNPGALVKLIHVPPAVSFDPKAHHVITKGFGGLERSILKWMAGHGARIFILLSERDNSAPETQSLTYFNSSEPMYESCLLRC